MNRQASLFGDGPAGNALVRVGVIGTKQSLSKAQKAFNRWIERIDTQRRELEQWQAFAEAFQARVAKDYEPLRRRLHAQRLALLRCFDQAHDGGALTRRERTRIARVILGFVTELLEQGEDPELVALHDKHSDVRHADLRRDQAEAMKAMAEDMLGATFEGDLHSPEDVFEAVGQWIEGEADAVEAEAERCASAKPRTARAQARLDREQALAEGATQSVREAYRKLASALHPDREPDPAERERKTALMQRANQAYEARDLLQLLTLQIEAEQIDLKRLAETSDARLEHYNRVLEEQSEGLAFEIEALTERFAMNMPGHSLRTLTPAAVLGALQRDIAALRRDCEQIAQDLALFKDATAIKAWLKTLRMRRH